MEFLLGNGWRTVEMVAVTEPWKRFQNKDLGNQRKI